jgi:hypothetical protein
MFVPPYHLIEPHIEALPSVDEGAERVVMPIELFHFLLRCALEGCEFDEAQYQRCNPDVADAVERGDVPSGREHFLGKGYLEGRVGAVPVHETWYLSHSPDVAAAKRAGLVASAEAHYRTIGVNEWRNPNPQSVVPAGAWRALLNRVSDDDSVISPGGAV